MRIIVTREEVKQMSIPDSIRFLSFANKNNAKIELDPSDLTLADYEEKTIVGIEMEGGKKVVHFYGYGYYSDGCDEDEKPYRFLEYCWFTAPIEEVLKAGVSEYESDNQDRFKQYITDCTEAECKKMYETYDNGRMPMAIDKEDLNADTPNGIYILF